MLLVCGAGDDLETSNFIETIEVLQEGALDQVVGNITLQERAFQLFEEVAFVVSKFRFEPVLREQEYLSICLPEAIALHPSPVFVIESRRRHRESGLALWGLRLEIQEAALNECLHGRNRKLDS